jgi:hypothetical protein
LKSVSLFRGFSILVWVYLLPIPLTWHSWST